MTFEAFDRLLEFVTELRPLLEAIAKRDSDLEKQLRRAVSSVGLNLAEGNDRRGGDRRRLFNYAYGSVAEALAAVHLAIAFGYFTEDTARPALELGDRVKAMTFRLSR